MFTEAIDYKIHPNKVEARIQDEKKKWMREHMKALVRNIEDPLTKDALQDRLNDKDMTLEDLAADIDLAIGIEDPTTDEHLQVMLDRLCSVKTIQDRVDAYKDAFILEEDGQSLPESRQKYIELLKTGRTMDDLLEQISLDHKTIESTQARRRELEERLSFFQRAKTAHGVKMAKKAAAKQERERALMRRRDKDRVQLEVPPELYKQPRCRVCRGHVSLSRGLRCCILCQLLASWKVRDSTVYCSERCFRSMRKGQVRLHSQSIVLTLRETPMLM